MTGAGIPDFAWAKPKPIADNSQAPTFDWATKTASPEAQKSLGFVDYTMNLAKNWFNVSGVQNMMEAEKLGVPVKYDDDSQKIRDQILKSRKLGSGTDQALGDFGNFFGKMFSGAGEQIKKVIQNPTETLDAITSDPVAFMGGFGKGLVKPVADFAELNSGVQLTGDDIHALTPEEKAERIKGTVAFGAMLAVTAGTGAGLRALGGGEAALAGMTTEQLVETSGLTAKGALAKSILRSGAAGAAGGIAYGAVGSANESDQLSSMLINGIQFGTLGAAHDLLFGGKGRTEQMSTAKHAGEIARIKQTQDVMDNSFKGVVNMTEALSTSDDLAEAVLNGRLKTEGNDIIHLPNVSSESIGRLTTHVPEGFSVAHRFNPDGETGDVLVYSDKHKGIIDKRFFSENGYVENQVVSYGGRKQYVVTDGDGKTLQITNVSDASEKLSVPRDAVRPLMFTEMGDPVGDRGTLRFGPLDRDAAISRIYQEWKQGLEKPDVPRERAIRTVDGKIIRNSDFPDAISHLEMAEKFLAKEGTPWSKFKERFGGAENVGGWMGAKGYMSGEQFQTLLDANEKSIIQPFEIPQHINDFLDGKGFKGDEKVGMNREFEKRLALEAYSGELSDANKKMMENAFKAMEEHNLEHSRAITSDRQMDSEKLVRLANSNGYTISDGGSGRVVIRDVQSGRILRGFDSNIEAAKFINQTAQTNGIDLDQGGPISAGGAGGGRGLPPEGPPPLPSNFPYNFFNTPRRIARALTSEHFLRGLDNLALITRNREFALNLDEKYGTQLHARVMEPTQQGVNIRNTKMTPMIEEAGAIEKVVTKMTAAEREMIGQRMQTMSPDEVISKFMARPMNALEQSLGREISESGVDLERIFKYNRELEKLGKEFENQPDKTEYNNQVAAARQAFAIDEEHGRIANLFNQITDMNKKEASLGAIVRYARALTGGPDGGPEMTRAQFDAHHRMTLDQIRASNMLDELYKKLGDTFGIPKETRLGGYMTHARLFTDGNISKALRHFSGDVQAREFYAKMSRTGEISAFETDPIRAMQRYIKAGFDAQGFNEAMASARNAMTEEIARLPKGAQAHAGNVMERYLADLRGFPAAQDTFAQEAVNEYSDRYNLQTTPEVRRQWVNGALSVIHSATIGARPMMGMFHWATATMISVADRGVEYTKRMHEQGAYARLHPEVMAEIQRVGALSTVSPISAYSSAEYAEQSALGNAVGKTTAAVSKGLFKLTGLPDVFEMLSSGHYLATKADAINAITRFNRDEIPWSQVKKELFLDKHYQPVADQFARLVKAGKTEEAAQFIGTQTVNDMVGMFGNANHPYMWGTNTGRILGQFGNWPLWLRSTVTRMASRGTAAQRIASVAKLGAMSWAGVAAGKQLGIDLSRMNVLEGMAWWGGPFEGIAEDVRDAIKGSGYTQQSGQRRLLKLLPVGKGPDGQLKLQASIFVPGSFAIDGITQAVADLQQGNRGMAAAQVVGLRPNKNFSIRDQ